MSSVHVARQGFITKSALPSLTRNRGSRNISNTVLLLNGNGTNGAQNNTFIDGSTNNFTITRNGNTTQGTFSPFSQAAGRWSNFFDGTGDYLALPSNTAFDVGTGDFTIEMWVNPSSLSSGIFKRYLNTTSAGIDLDAGKFRWWKDGSGNILTSTTTAVVGTWYHIAYSRSGTSFKLYVNGTEESSATNSDSFNFSLWDIGRGFYGNQYSGYISNFRLVKGTAVYTSNFTVPTAPLTAITNTSLLTCQDNRFRDGSTNNFTITRNGDVTVTPFSPFQPTAAYDAATNGGSGFFDGTGDYLSVADNSVLRFGTGTFTIQAWVYRSASGTTHTIASKGATTPTGWVFQITSTNVLRFTHTSTNIDSTGTIPAGQWVHVAVVREGTGTNQLKLYINGTADGQGTVSTDFNQTEALNIGADRSNATPMNGYIAGLRYVVGTAETITVPTAPPTAIANTQLLCNFTNAGIFDAAGDNVIETVGNAQIDTAVKQFGSGSLEFDGTGDYLVIPNSVDVNMQGSDFTLEAWIYPTATKAAGILGKDGQSAVSWAQYSLELNSSNRLVGIVSTTTTSNPPGSPSSGVMTSTSIVATNTWTHVALSKTGTTVRIFINGNLEATSTTAPATLNTRNRPLAVGANTVDSGIITFQGYIDDVRITKGIARYTANFTPPTAEFVITNDTVPTTVTNAVYGVYQIA